MAMAELVVIRGAGDLATGVIQKFWRAGIPLLVLEAPRPTAIRRTVSLCDAVYEGKAQVEDVTCRLVQDDDEMRRCQAGGNVPLMVDPRGAAITRLHPIAVVDAIIAKRNLGTSRDMAPITIALGPGFEAGRDVDAAVETLRGHDLGRLLFTGSALPNTGVPAEIGRQSELRVLHAPAAGAVRPFKNIGDIVQKGEDVLEVGGHRLTAAFTGLLRGMIRPGLKVPAGMKIADIDPRTDVDVSTISDKARCIGGGALEAYLYLKSKRGAP